MENILKHHTAFKTLRLLKKRQLNHKLYCSTNVARAADSITLGTFHNSFKILYISENVIRDVPTPSGQLQSRIPSLKIRSATEAY
jgi:hypothetical protein